MTQDEILKDIRERIVAAKIRPCNQCMTPPPIFCTCKARAMMLEYRTAVLEEEAKLWEEYSPTLAQSIRELRVCDDRVPTKD